MAQAGHLQVEAHLEHSPKNFQTNLRCSYPVRRMDSPEYEKAAPTKYRTLPNTGHCINACTTAPPRSALIRRNICKPVAARHSMRSQLCRYAASIQHPAALLSYPYSDTEDLLLRSAKSPTALRNADTSRHHILPLYLLIFCFSSYRFQISHPVKLLICSFLRIQFKYSLPSFLSKTNKNPPSRVASR